MLVTCKTDRCQWCAYDAEFWARPEVVENHYGLSWRDEEMTLRVDTRVYREIFIVSPFSGVCHKEKHMRPFDESLIPVFKAHARAFELWEPMH